MKQTMSPEHAVKIVLDHLAAVDRGDPEAIALGKAVDDLLRRRMTIKPRIEQAICFVFGDPAPSLHYDHRFYLVRSMADGWWYIRRFPSDSGAWSRSDGGIWTSFMSDDIDACRFTLEDGWAEAERILAGGMHLREEGDDR